jgi:DNA ligase-1
MRFARIAETSRAVAATRARLAKAERLADCLRELAPDEIEVGVAYLAGELPQGRVGVGFAALRDVIDHAPAADAPSLALDEVHRRLEEIAGERGAGSAARRREALGALFARATREEQRLLGPLLVGELRQGALEAVLVDAVAKASGVPADAVRRARMFAGSLGPVARAALTEGAAGLARFRLELFRPLQPMLAQTAEDVAAAFASLGDERAAFEWKLDGARVQAHREGDLVRVFTRRLHEVTDAVPEVVEIVRALPVRACVLDGEAIALRADGAPQPFQETMRRFGRRLGVEALRRELPLRAFFFDCLHLDGDDLAARAAGERWQALAERVPASARVPRLVTASPEEAGAFVAGALAAGHEGALAKSLAAPYEAGRRGAAWLKLKPAHTLDLVVLAAEWGSGRRRGLLSNLHLGARDPAAGGFVMLGKTFKGMTDAVLAWQTEALQRLAVARDGHVVHVRPELVVEIAFDGVQASPHYPGGVALRFARLRRYRPDKRAEDADTIESVRAIHARGAARGEGDA